MGLGKKHGLSLNSIAFTRGTNTPWVIFKVDDLGNNTAILSPIVAGTVLQITNSWSIIFYICAGMLIFGGIFYLIFASANKQFD